jgi:hypothetical protein
MMKKKATEDQFNELHNLVTKEFLARIKSGEATTQDLKAACDWLKTNDISGVALEGSPLDKLANIMPQIDPELVQTRLYGKQNV